MAASRHLFERCLSVGLGRVHVQVAADLLDFDQTWQRAGLGPFEFAAGFA